MWRDPHEQEVTAAVSLDAPWALVQRFNGLVRDSGSKAERRGVDYIIKQLAKAGVPHALHEPELLISPGERIHEGICTTIWGSPDLDSIGRKPTIPVLAVNKAEGAWLRALAEAGAVKVRYATKLDEGWRPIPVLVAEIRGTVEPEKFVLLHGHIDSWHQGIGDNATGDATLLEVARVLVQHRQHLRRSVRIAWWSGHSHGRYAGSTWS